MNATEQSGTEDGDRADVVVIGGGAAGLSAALALGRSRRTVRVIDSGEPRNAPADGVHNVLALDGTAPGELLRRGRADLETYGVTVDRGRVTDVSSAPNGDDPVGFTVTVAADGGETRVHARRVVVASGSADVLPDVPGLAEQWGRGVVHCPYCHGWEVRDRRIGVLLTSALQAHQVGLFRQLSDDITVFVTESQLADATERERWAARGVTVVDGPVRRVLSEGGRLSGVRTSDGATYPLDALAVASAVEARVDFLAGVGLRPVDSVAQGHRTGSVLEVSGTGETYVRGIYAAGNLTNPMAMVAMSAAAGTQVGAVVNADLVTADTDAATASASAA